MQILLRAVETESEMLDRTDILCFSLDNFIKANEGI